MAGLPQQYNVNINERTKAVIRLNDCFKPKLIQSFNFFSTEIVPYLTDYFVLSEDLRARLNEESRKSYFDYGFVILPVHKALESYLIGLFTSLFHLEVSKKIPLGNHLGLSDEAKIKHIDTLAKRFSFTLTKDEWVARWNELKTEWSTGRNPLIHSSGERTTTLQQADMIAISIIRKMDLSIQLFTKELIDPLVDLVEKENKQAKALEIKSTQSETS